MMNRACSARLPLERLERAITPAVATQLERDGFAVVDGVFGALDAAALRYEITHLQQARLRLGIPANRTCYKHAAATARYAAWRMT